MVNIVKGLLDEEKMEEKFQEIFALYQNDVLRLAYSYTKSKTDAEDIFQNVFVKLFKHPKILALDNLEIKKWLMKVTINECKNFFLSSWRRKIILLDEKTENSLSTAIKEDETLPAVLKLPRKYRLVTYLFYYENYKIKEIAKILNSSEANIRTILVRSREKLRTMLEGEKNAKYCG